MGRRLGQTRFAQVGKRYVMNLHTVVALILSGAIGISLGLLGGGGSISAGHPNEGGNVAVSGKN